MTLTSIEFSDFLTITSIIVAVLVAFITWIVTWLTLRAQLARKQLSYFMKMVPIISHDFSGSRGELKITYNGEQIDRLVLLEVDIKNTGNSPIESPAIKVSNQGGIYLIPGYFEDVPVGYETLWSIAREDGEDSNILLEHINPGQTAKVRFIMDNLPNSLPEISCPMVGLSFKKATYEEFKTAFQFILETAIASYPSIGGIYKR